jgi:hypothetical protein
MEFSTEVVKKMAEMMAEKMGNVMRVLSENKTAAPCKQGRRR